MTDYAGKGGDAARDFECGLIKRAFRSDPKTLAVILEAATRKGR